MPAAEQFVPRHVQIAIVAFEIAVVDLVVEVAQVQALFVAEKHTFEPCVRGDRQEAVKHQVEYDVDGMAGDGEVSEHRAEIEKVLDGVHRHARPWADICVAVMQGVKAVHDFGVQATVHPIEIKALPNWDEEENGDEPDGVGFKRDGAGITVSHGPPEQDFKRGPDGNAAADGPDDVVFHLV